MLKKTAQYLFYFVRFGTLRIGMATGLLFGSWGVCGRHVVFRSVGSPNFFWRKRHVDDASACGLGSSLPGGG